MKIKKLCELCKKTISKNPDFIDVDKIKVGMKLKNWYETEYKPTHGKFSPCNSFTLVRKVDGDLIFHSIHGNSHVDINTRAYFINSTELK